jgi:hypothetical protein
MVFPKVTVYHSTLRERTAENPVRLMLTSLPRASRYPGKPEYVTFEVVGDSTSYTYQCETPAIREQLDSLPVREWLDVRAFGAKDAAVLEVEPVSTSVDAPARSPMGEMSPIGNTPAGVTHGSHEAAPSLSRAYWDALDAAVAIVEAFRKRHGREPSEAERCIATGLWIEQNRSNGRRPLCTKEG